MERYRPVKIIKDPGSPKPFGPYGSGTLGLTKFFYRPWHPCLKYWISLTSQRHLLYCTIEAPCAPRDLHNFKCQYPEPNQSLIRCIILPFLNVQLFPTQEYPLVELSQVLQGMLPLSMRYNFQLASPPVLFVHMVGFANTVLYAWRWYNGKLVSALGLPCLSLPYQALSESLLLQATLLVSLPWI